MICPQDNSKDFDDLDCRDCQWFMQCLKMWRDENIYNKEKPTGDNFPVINNNQEQEVRNSMNTIGDYSTWEMIEAIANAKVRLRYRLIFLKLGGKIPEKEE